MDQQRPSHPQSQQNDLANPQGSYDGVTIDLSTVPRLQLHQHNRNINPRGSYEGVTIDLSTVPRFQLLQHNRNINPRRLYEGLTIDLSTVPRLQLPIRPNNRQFFFPDTAAPNEPVVSLRQLEVELRGQELDRPVACPGDGTQGHFF